MNFLQAQNVNCMHWPSLSPDMAPIEHAWDALGRRVDNRPVKVLAKSSLRPLLCVDARYLAGRSLDLDGLETLEQHKEPGFHLYSVVR
jgi:hypothetical protein